MEQNLRRYVLNPPGDGYCIVWAIQFIICMSLHKFVDLFEVLRKILNSDHEFFKNPSTLLLHDVIAGIQEYYAKLITDEFNAKLGYESDFNQIEIMIENLDPDLESVKIYQLLFGIQSSSFEEGLHKNIMQLVIHSRHAYVTLPTHISQILLRKEYLSTQYLREYFGIIKPRYNLRFSFCDDFNHSSHIKLLNSYAIAFEIHSCVEDKFKVDFIKHPRKQRSTNSRKSHYKRCQGYEREQTDALLALEIKKEEERRYKQEQQDAIIAQRMSNEYERIERQIEKDAALAIQIERDAALAIQIERDAALAIQIERDAALARQLA